MSIGTIFVNNPSCKMAVRKIWILKFARNVYIGKLSVHTQVYSLSRRLQRRESTLSETRRELSDTRKELDRLRKQRNENGLGVQDVTRELLLISYQFLRSRMFVNIPILKIF